MRRSTHTAALLVTAAMALLVGGTQAVASPGSEGEPAAAASASRTSPGVTEAAAGPRVEGQVTRVLFDEPQRLGELTKTLKGLTVLQLRYTGDVGGVSQSGPGASVTKAVKDMRQDTVARWGAEPLVYMAVVDGKLPSSTKRAQSLAGAVVKYFASDSGKVDDLPQGTLAAASKATREREARLVKQGVRVPDPKWKATPGASAPSSASPKSPKSPGKEFPWSPVSVGMDAWYYPEGPQDDDYPNTFNHKMVWSSSGDIDAFGDDFGYEHGLALYNEEDISGRPWTRPACAPWDSIVSDEYQNFWAAWDIWSFKWNAVSYGWNIPGEAAPYWDWDDVTDECSKLEFTVGIGYPRKLDPNVEYGFWIYAMDGDQESSPFYMGGQRLSNDCNDMGLDPGSSCMGLNDERPGADTQLFVNRTRDWRVPGCIEWYDGGPPVRSENGEGDCPASDV